MASIEHGPITTKQAIQENFEQLENKTDKIEALAPNTIGVGAESAVFSLEKAISGDTTQDWEIQRHRGVVAKVDMRAIERTLVENARLERPPEALSDKRREQLLQDIESIKQRNSELKARFPGATIPERFYIEPIPVNKDILFAAASRNEDLNPPDEKPLSPRATLLRDAINRLPDTTVMMPTMMRLQLKVPAEILNDPNTIDLAGGYREHDNRVTPEQYQAWNQDLITGKGEHAAEYLKSIDSSPETGTFHRLVEQTQTDRELKAVLKEFTESAVKYSEETGEMLDIFGAKNILTHKDPKTGRWKITFMDALFPTKQAWDKCQDIVGTDSQDPKSSRTQVSAGINLLNYARNLNALAAISGAEARLHLPEHVLSKADTIFNQARQEISIAPSNNQPEQPAVPYAEQPTVSLGNEEDYRRTELLPAATPAEADDQMAA